MRLATIYRDSSEEAAIVTAAGLLPISIINRELNRNWSTNLLVLIQTGQLAFMTDWYRTTGREELAALSKLALTDDSVQYAPLYRHPSKIWGIGLNYVDHAGDLAEKAPTLAPASFAKFDTTIIGAGESVVIPPQSEKTTGEAELAIIFSKRCKNVEEADWQSVIAGFTTVIDMTAEDVLRINPRYLTRAKNYDTFLSFGPVLVTPDEIDDVLKLNVATVINGGIHAQNVVSNMTFPPAYLVSFHSKVATMLPGDVILTGTPRAVQLMDGDVIECRINGFKSLINPVIDAKVIR